MPRHNIPADARIRVPADQRPFFVSLMGDGPAGARLITSPNSALVVGAAPIGELGLLLQRPTFKERPLSYLMHASAGHDLPWAQLKVGESLDPRSRFATHFRDPPVSADEIILIGSYHDSFGKDAILALQHALTAQAIRAGRCRVFGAPPTRSWLQETNAAQLTRWLAELRPMLMAAGFTLLEPPGPRLRPRIVIMPDPGPILPEPEILPEPVPAVVSGYRLDLPHGLLNRAGAARYALAWDAVRAEAVVVDGWTVLRRGSLVARTETSGIQACLARKRESLLQAGVLRPAGRRELWRIDRHVALPSLTNAGRVATGSNEPGTLWSAA